MRQMHTLRKLPMRVPKMKDMMRRNMFIDSGFKISISYVEANISKVQAIVH